VALGGNGFGLGAATGGTGIGFYACGFTPGLSGNNALVIAVAGDSTLGCAAAITLTGLGSGAGGCTPVVSQGSNGFVLSVATIRILAGVDHYAGFGTGSGSFNHTLVIVVVGLAVNVDHSLCCGTACVFTMCGFGAIVVAGDIIIQFIVDENVVQHINIFGIAMALGFRRTSGTGVGLYALGVTGGRGGIFTLVIAVAQGRNGLLGNFVAAAGSLAFQTHCMTISGTGGSRCFQGDFKIMPQGGKHYFFIGYGAAKAALGAGGVTVFGTGGGLRGAGIVSAPVVAKGGNLFGIAIAAARAGKGFYTLYSTGGLGGNLTLIVMTQSRVQFYAAAFTGTDLRSSTGGGSAGDMVQSLDQSSTANGTGLGCGTGSSSARSMAEGIHGFLFGQHFSAHVTMAAFGKTGFGTGGSHGGIGHRGVAEGIHNVLGNQHLVASTTMLAFGEAGFGTGGGHGGIGNGGVFVVGGRGWVPRVAVSTVFAGTFIGGEATIGTGGGGYHNTTLGYIIFVTQSINIFSLFGTAAAVLTGIGGIALFGTGGGSYLNGDKAVPGGIDNGLGDQHFVAHATMAAFGKAGFGTAGIHSFIGHRGVAEGTHNSLGFDYFAADRAMLAFGQAGVGAIGGYGFIDHFGVAKSTHNSLGFDYFAADRAVLAFGQAGFSTGRGLVGIDHLVWPRAAMVS